MRALAYSAALAALLAAPAAGFSQPEPGADRSAQVILTDGRPAGFAEVEVISQGARRVGLTGSDGRFAFTDEELADPDTRVTVRAPGLPEQSRTMAELRASALVLAIRPASAAAADRVVVTGRRISRAFAPRTLDRLSILTGAASRADPVLAVDAFAFSTNTEGSAELSLRGIRPSANRVYFNDIPLYETARGSGIDLITRSGSVLSPSLVAEVEIHPSNPPAFLAGSAGGALRLLPDTIARDGAFAFASTAGVSGAITRAGSSPSRFVQGFATVTDLAPALALNRGLSQTLDHFRSQSVGLFAQSGTADRLSAQALLQFDAEDGAYPINLFGFEDVFANRRQRAYALASVEQVFGTWRVKLDGAATGSRTRERFGNLETDSTNRYLFASLDAAGSPSPDLELRFGADLESVRLVSDGEGPADPLIFDPAAPSVPVARRESATDAHIYLYATRRFGDGASTFAGVRQPVSGDGKTGFQAGLSLTPDGGRNRITLAGGRYHGADLPRLAADGFIRQVRTDQAALDITRRLSFGTASLAVFASETETDGSSRVRSAGAEASVTAQLTSNLDVSLALTHLRQRINTAQGETTGASDLPIIARASLSYAFSPTRLFNLSYTARAGVPVTNYAGAEPSTLAPGFERPVFGPFNGERLGAYHSLDVNVVGLARFVPGDVKPIGFIALTNVLNQSNPRALSPQPGFTQTRELSFPGRAVTIGLAWTF
jgi:hypothetical protein